jgi:Cu+-exporting ATPase
MTAYDIVNGNSLYLFLLLILSTLIQFGSGSGFYIGAYKSVKHGSANMDVLVVLGTTSAWLYGVILMFMGHNLSLIQSDEMRRMQIQMHGHNFEISSTLITVILLGKLLEATSKKQTVDKLA